MVDDRRRSPQDDPDVPAGGPAGRGGVGPLAGFDAIAGGYYVVVVAGVEEVAPGGAGRRGDATAVGTFGADVIDAVGEVGAEERVLAGAGGGDAGAGDRPGPLEGGVETRRRERGI